MTEHLSAMCPLAPVKKALWRNDVASLATIPMTASEIRWLREHDRLTTNGMPYVAARPGFYKLDLDNDHPHW